MLGHLGFLPSAESSDEDAGDLAGPSSTNTSRQIVRSSIQNRGAPWFEELVENTKLGRFKQRRGGHSSRDGSVRVEWEIMEWTEGDADDEAGPASSKRKIGDIEGEDTEMRTV